MKRVLALVIVCALVGASSLPALPLAGGEPGETMQTPCPVCHNGAAAMKGFAHGWTAGMRHCRIECCNHHDTNGLPHLLAPHSLSLTGLGVGLVVNNVAPADLPSLKPRLLPYPVPPPRPS